MLFNSLHFALFFPVVAVIYFLIPHKLRWILLLAASYYFYMAWKPIYAILIIVSTVIDYISSMRIGASNSKLERRIWLLLSLLTNFGLLFSFKYYNFFNESLAWITSYMPLTISFPRMEWLLPVGISFYTFQTVSYTIDVYRRQQKPEKHFGYFALYVSFFPQLVAGPIERPGNLLPQFRQKHYFDYCRVTNGLKLMAWGLLKKVVIADQLAPIVDAVYNDPGNFTGPMLVIATICFAFQIYCDFSGYSDIAIGASNILGIKLMRNFNQPYLAHSITDFWKRWHISLSTWFRDYVYLSLGGNRVKKHRWYLNLMIVFMVSGLWHGASWTFVVWGALHGTFIILYHSTHTIREKIASLLLLNRVPRIHSFLQVLTTFCFVVFAWIFFRADSLGDAFQVIGNLHTGWSSSSELYKTVSMIFGDVSSDVITLCALGLLGIVSSMLLVEYFEPPLRLFSERSITKRWLVYWILFVVTFTFGAFKQSAFIYFQF